MTINIPIEMIFFVLIAIKFIVIAVFGFLFYEINQGTSDNSGVAIVFLLMLALVLEAGTNILYHKVETQQLHNKSKQVIEKTTKTSKTDSK